MNNLTDSPPLVFAISLVALSLSAWLGASARQRLDQDSREDFGVILAATLTLLGLIIGFSFSMAINRYDQRKSYEEAEANAIGTEYLRADLLPTADAAVTRRLLESYLAQRISFYRTRDPRRLKDIDSQTLRLQKQLWDAVRAPATAQPYPVLALVVAGMNDVLNSQGYTQAAWWNRIPVAAWALMGMVAIVCNAMIGFGGRGPRPRRVLLVVLPLVLSISFFLIADIDSPRGGVIRVSPQNLLALAESLRG